MKNNSNNSPSKGFCPKCSEYPSIKILTNVVHVKCKCGYDSVIGIKDYLKEVENIECKNTIELPEKDIKEKLEEASDHIKEYFTMLRDTTIEMLNEQIEQVKNECINATNRNTDILNLIKKLVSNYDGNEIMHENIIQNTNFDLAQDLDCKKTMEYFSSYSLLTGENFNLSEFKHSTTIPLTIGDRFLMLKDGRLATANCNGEFNVTEPDNNFKEDFLSSAGCQNGICQLDNGKLVLLEEGKIKIFSVFKDTIQREFKIKNSNEQSTYLISLPNNHFAASFEDGVINIWNGNEPYSDKPVAILEANNEQSVNSMVYIKELNLIIVGMDESVYVWSNETYQKVKCIEGVRCNVAKGNALKKIDKERVITGEGNTFYIINVQNGIVEKTITDEQFGDINSMVLLPDNETVLIGIQEGKICVYDLKTEDYKIIKTVHNTGISDMIVINENKIASCSMGNNVEIYNFKLSK